MPVNSEISVKRKHGILIIVKNYFYLNVMSVKRG